MMKLCVCMCVRVQGGATPVRLRSTRFLHTHSPHTTPYCAETSSAGAPRLFFLGVCACFACVGLSPVCGGMRVLHATHCSVFVFVYVLGVLTATDVEPQASQHPGDTAQCAPSHYSSYTLLLKLSKAPHVCLIAQCVSSDALGDAHTSFFVHTVTLCADPTGSCRDSRTLSSQLAFLVSPPGGLDSAFRTVRCLPHQRTCVSPGPVKSCVDTRYP